MNKFLIFLITALLALTSHGATKYLQGDGWKSSDLATTWLPPAASGRLLGASLDSTKVFVGNASNVAIGVVLSGDATIANTGVMTLNTVSAAKGGTGNTSYTKGDILAASSSSALSKVAVGSNGQTLIASSDATAGVVWTGLEKTEYLQVNTSCTSSPCTITRQGPNSCFTSVTRASTGNYTVNYGSSCWSAAPVCNITVGASTVNISAAAAYVTLPTTTSFNFIVVNTVNSLVDNVLHIICSGPR